MDKAVVDEVVQMPHPAATIGRMIREAEGNKPRNGSKGWHELQEENRFVAAAPWGDTPVFEAHSQALLRLAAAEDHLFGMERVLGEPVLAFSPLTLCRGVLESAGRAWWTLDPAISVELRICRAKNERYFSLLEQAKMPIDDTKIKRSRERADDLVKRADSLGLPVFRDKGWRPIAIGDRDRPTSTELIEGLLQTAGLGEDTYRWTSGVAHATLYGIMSQVTPVDDADAEPEVRTGLLEASDTSIVMTSALSVLGYTEAFNRIVDRFDWSVEDWRSLKRSSEETISFALAGLRLFHVGSARASLGGPSTRMRSVRRASAHVIRPRFHSMSALGSASTKSSTSNPGYVAHTSVRSPSKIIQ